MEKAKRGPCLSYRKFLTRFLKEVRSYGNKEKEWTVRKHEEPRIILVENILIILAVSALL